MNGVALNLHPTMQIPSLHLHVACQTHKECTDPRLLSMDTESPSEKPLWEQRKRQGSVPSTEPSSRGFSTEVMHLLGLG